MKRQDRRPHCAGVGGTVALSARPAAESLLIEHTPVVVLSDRGKPDHRRRAPGARGMRILFRFPGVDEFQVRKMTRRRRTTISPTPSIPARSPGRPSIITSRPSARARSRSFRRGPRPRSSRPAGEGGPPPEIPADLPSPAPAEGKVTWPVSLTGTAQAVMYEKDEASTPKDLPLAGNVRLAADYRKGDTNVVFDSTLTYSNTPVPGEKDIDLANMAVSVVHGQALAQGGRRQYHRIRVHGPGARPARPRIRLQRREGLGPCLRHQFPTAAGIRRVRGPEGRPEHLRRRGRLQVPEGRRLPEGRLPFREGRPHPRRQRLGILFQRPRAGRAVSSP